MTHLRQVIDQNEIYLASFDPATNETLRHGRFPLLKGTFILQELLDLFPARISINDSGRAPGGLASAITLEDQTAGQGIQEMRDDGSPGRFWFSTCDTIEDSTYPRQITLNRKKTARANSHAGARVPRFGIAWVDKVWVAFDERVYSYTQAASWDTATFRSLTGGGIPQSAPLVWGQYLLWFLGSNGIEYTDGATWTNVAVNASAGVVIGDVLYIVSETGEVSRSATKPPTAASFSPVTTVNERRDAYNDGPSAMLAFQSANNETIPYVIGDRTIYAIDVNAGLFYQAGPQMTPSPYAIRAEVLTADNQMYIAQGMSVLAWDGDTAQHLGLDRDDGVPPEYKGGITRLLNGNTSLYALTDTSLLAVGEEQDLWAGEEYNEMFYVGEGNAVLWERTSKGWHVRAIADSTVLSATMLFLSDSEDTYYLWFAWGGTAYTIDLSDANINFEASGLHQYPKLDYGYHENVKVGVRVECRALRCNSTEKIKIEASFDGGGWFTLRNGDTDSNGYIITAGRHVFDLHLNPVPLTVSPLVWHDDPPAGYPFHQIQLRSTLERGSDATLSPGLTFSAVYAVKSNKVKRAWTINLDLTDGHKDKTAYQLDQLLVDLFVDAEEQMLQLAYRPIGVSGAMPPQVYSVKPTGAPRRGTTGEVDKLKQTVRLTLTEV